MRLDITMLIASGALLFSGCIMVSGDQDDTAPNRPAGRTTQGGSGTRNSEGGGGPATGGSTQSGKGGSQARGGSTNTGTGNSGAGTGEGEAGSDGSSGGSGGSGEGTGGSGEGTGGSGEGTGGSNTGGSGGTGSGGTGSGGTGSGGTGSGGTGSLGSGGSGNSSGESGECRRMLGDVPACCTANGANKENVQEVFELLNAYRVSVGLSALAYDIKLEEAVQAHCMHMAIADFFAHDSPTPGLVSPWDRAKYCGTSANGENIAAGQRSPADVMNSWKNSSGHDRNMRGNFKRVGIGEYQLNWGQLFGG